MSRKRIPTVVLVAAAALVGLLVYGVVRQQQGRGSDRLDKLVAQGRLPPAPSADLRRPVTGGQGREQRLADLEGKVVVVNFYASWCIPCETEAPILARAQASLAAQGDGTVLGVANDDAEADALGFLRKHALTFPSVGDPDSTLYRAFGNSGVPETMVLDRRGRLVAISRGALTDDRFLTAAIARARAS